MKNQLLVSSDHHANWNCLDELFQIASKKKIPFVINGDLIGDYNFEEIVKGLNLKFPYEITGDKLKENLGEELYSSYITYMQIRQNKGNYDFLLQGVSQNLIQEAKNKIEEIIKYIEGKEFQNKINSINEKIGKETDHIISNHKLQLRALYSLIVKEHAIELAKLIDKHKVEVYFLNGNHEPIYFPNLVLSYLKNKDLFHNLGELKGVTNVNGIKIAGVPNVNALMPFLHNLYDKEELDFMFSHQRDRREILYQNVHEDTLKNSNKHLNDQDWIRIMGEEKKELDVFFTHGQVGRGAWRSDKFANEMPTLYVAGMLSYLAKLTVDGHLHTSHEMENPFGKQTIRAVGDKGYILTKTKDEKIEYELVQVETEYKHTNGIDFSNVNLKEKVLQELFTKN